MKLIINLKTSYAHLVCRNLMTSAENTNIGEETGVLELARCLPGNCVGLERLLFEKRRELCVEGVNLWR